MSTTKDTYSPQGGTYGLAVLVGLSAEDKHVYGGTVSAKTIATRRTRNRVAHKSRRTNRLRAR